MKKLLLLLCLATSLSPLCAQTREEYRDFLVKNEGYSLKPYDNNTHVGIGHLFKPGERRGVYTSIEVEKLFAHDLAYAIKSCELAFRGFDYLPKDTKLVLVSLSFSVGRTGLMRFRHLRTAIKHRYYDGAAIELADSKWFRQVSRTRAMQAYTILLTAK